MRALSPFPLLLLFDYAITIVATTPSAWLNRTSSFSALHPPNNFLRPISSEHIVRVDVPNTQTTVVLSLRDHIDVATLENLIQSAQGYIETHPPEEAPESPFHYEINLIAMTVFTIPGQHLPWGILHNVLEGLESYLVDGRHEKLCSFQILQEGVRVGWGRIQKMGPPPPSPGGGVAVS